MYCNTVCVFAAVLAFTTSMGAQQNPLTGTSWQLVRFEGGDGEVVKPDDGSKYTIAFGADGALTARIDCNRGRGTWKSPSAGQLVLGPMALTRAMCLPPSMHDRIIKHWTSIRSYVIKDGHLYLSLMADGGNYEFQPVAAGSGATTATFKTPVAVIGPVTFQCESGEPIRATFYKTEPGMALLERGTVTLPVFQVRSGSGARYESDGVQFWEGRGQVTVHWKGSQSICKRN